MKLLFLTPQLPHPPRQGTAIRNWGLIKQLALRHRISLLSFAEEGQGITAELRAACERVITVPVPQRTRLDRIKTLFTPHADLARRLWSPEFAKQLETLLSENAFDIVQVEGLELASYISIVRRPSSVVFDAHNAEITIQQRALATDIRQPRRWLAALYSALQVPRLRKLERRTLQQAAAVSCVSLEDAASLRGLVPSLKPVIVPNGIELALYTQRATRPTSHLVFTGKMDYRPNVDAVLWFAHEILPRIRARFAEVEFWVVGQKPPDHLRSLAGVHVTGAVEDVRPYIAEAAVYVAPLRMGGGTRFKLLEAMALTRPIVSTTVGAEGFAVKNGREMLLADAPEVFAEAVGLLLNDHTQAQRLAEAGHTFVSQRYDWSVIVPELEQAYARLRIV